MGQEAIQTDVIKTKHDEAYEALIAKRQVLKDAQASEKQEETGTPEEVVEEEHSEPVIEFMSGDDVIRVPASAKFRAKVDGEEFEQTIDNITRSYQKDASGDKKLEQAARQRREAERIFAEVQKKEADLTVKEQALIGKMGAIEKQREEGSLSDDGYKKAASMILKALTDDDANVEDEIAKALQSIATKNTVDESAILSKTDERIAKRIEEMERQAVAASIAAAKAKANQWFSETYKDIAEDPNQFAIASRITKATLQANPDASPMEVAKIAGETTKEYIAKLSGGRKAPVTPKAATTRAKIGEDVKLPTRKDILNDYKKFRGQTVF